MSAVTCVFASHANAILLASGDNDVNQTDPGTGVPFHAVALICNDGGSSPAGSAVYLGGKYLITANHVANRTHITFDGSTYWARDTGFTPLRIGEVDMKLIKLIDDPEIAGVSLNTNSSNDTSSDATLVGWGRAHDISTPSPTTSGQRITWDWGENDTISKRWGTNRVEGSETVTTSGNYTGLFTYLDNSGGDNEAAMITYDSGSGLFIEIDDQWYLAGLTTLVSQQSGSGTSTFGGNSPFNRGDKNSFVRISSYATDIEAAIPDTTTFAGWITDHGIYDASAEADADPDLDGLSNLLEFALNSDPNLSSVEDAPESSFTNGNSMIRFRKSTSATGIQIIPEWSSTLEDDSWLSSDLFLANTGFEDGVEIWTATYTGSENPVFLRLTVTEE